MRILKKTLIFVFTAALMLSTLGISTVFAAAGETGNDQDFDWIEVADGQVSVTHYTGGGGTVGIPATLSGRAVVSIAADAFSSVKTTLTSVEIPAGVDTIAANTFKDFTALESVTFAQGTKIATIGEGAFAGSALLGFTVPATVTGIGKDAFKGCLNFASITFETGALGTIGEGAFAGTPLVSVRIPASVTAIGDNAFLDCTKLTGVTFAPDSGILTIGSSAFHGIGITNLTIPESITGIGADAFSGCSALAKVIVLGTTIDIGTNAFELTPTLWNGAIYGRSGSSIATYCIAHEIPFRAIEYLVGPTSITSIVSSSSTSATIMWSVADRATGYEVRRSESSGGTYSTVKDITSTSTTYTDTGLTVNKAYYYKVVGYCQPAGPDTPKYYGDLSAYRSITPLPPAPQSVYAVSTGYNSIKVSWTPVAGMTGYEIWRSVDRPDAAYKRVKDFKDTTTTTTGVSILSVAPKYCSFSGLSIGRKYYYKVRGYKQTTTTVGRTTTTSAKLYGAFSGVTYAVPTLSQVKNLQAKVLNPTSIKLTWDKVAGRTKYIVMRKGPGDSDYAQYGKATYNNYYTNTVYCGQPYSYKVYAYRRTGGKTYIGAESVSVTLSTTVSKVTGLSAYKSSTGTIKTSWSGLTNVSGYEVWRSTSSTAPSATPGSEFTRVYIGTSRYYYNSGLTTGTMYYYWVRAYNASVLGTVYGDFSDSRSATA